MIKHVNFTGRRRIPRSRIQIHVHAGQPRTFDAAINLAELDLPDAAKVFLEATSAGATIVQRFAFGTVDRIQPPQSRKLDAIKGDKVIFSLKVVDQTTERVGRILGIAENLPVKQENQPSISGGKGILPIETAELGQQLWDLDFGEHDVCLRVNSDVPGLKERARSDPLFYAVVYPAVLTAVLYRAIQSNADADDEEGRWPSQWLRFGRNLHPERASPPSIESSEEERDEWVEEIVASFCDAHTMKDSFLKAAPFSDGSDL